MWSMWWTPLLFIAEYVVEPSAAQCWLCGGALCCSMLTMRWSPLLLNSEYVVEPLATQLLIMCWTPLLLSIWWTLTCLVLSVWRNPLLLNAEYLVEPSAAQCWVSGGTLCYSIAEYTADPIATVWWILTCLVLCVWWNPLMISMCWNPLLLSAEYNNNNILYSSPQEIKTVIQLHNEEHISIILSHETHADAPFLSVCTL